MGDGSMNIFNVLKRYFLIDIFFTLFFVSLENVVSFGMRGSKIVEYIGFTICY